MRDLQPTSKAVKALGMSDRTLRNLRQQGVLQPGLHFAVRGSGITRPRLLWDVPAIQQALAQRACDLLS